MRGGVEGREGLEVEVEHTLLGSPRDNSLRGAAPLLTLPRMLCCMEVECPYNQSINAHA